MFGSKRKEFVRPETTRAEEFFSVRVLGRTLWGWQRRDESGDVLACSQALFDDYVACLCDAQRRN